MVVIWSVLYSIYSSIVNMLVDACLERVSRARECRTNADRREAPVLDNSRHDRIAEVESFAKLVHFIRPFDSLAFHGTFRL
jgi:hypothetical protein